MSKSISWITELQDSFSIRSTLVRSFLINSLMRFLSKEGGTIFYTQWHVRVNWNNYSRQNRISMASLKEILSAIKYRLVTTCEYPSYIFQPTGKRIEGIACLDWSMLRRIYFAKDFIANSVYVIYFCGLRGLCPFLYLSLFL